MKQRMILAIAAVSILTLGSPAMAHGDKGGCAAHAAHGKKGGHHAIPGNSLHYLRSILKKADMLKLDKKQRSKVAELLVRAETAAAEAHAKAEVTVAEFRSKLHTGSASDKEVEAYTRRMGELRTERLQAVLNATVKASRLLSDEQKKLLHAHKGKAAWKASQ